MTERDMDVAKSGERRMAIRPDGSALAPATPATHETWGDATIPDDAVRAHDGSASNMGPRHRVHQPTPLASGRRAPR